MKYTPTSSAFDEIDYDPETGKLKVTFTGGRKSYDFEGVPVEVMQQFQAQDVDPEGSAGRFFSTNIKGSYHASNEAQQPQPEKAGNTSDRPTPPKPEERDTPGHRGQVPAREARDWER